MARNQTQQQHHEPAQASSKARGKQARAAKPFHADLASLRYLGNHSPGATDAAGRAQWLVRFYRSGAHLDMLSWNSDALCERFGITERTFDDCFEMGDSAEVLSEFMPVALADKELGNAVRSHIGAASFDEWACRAANAAPQMPLL